MPDGITVNLDGHLAAFARMASASKKDLPTLWRQEAKICFGGTNNMPGVADITPPYSQDTYRNSRAAEEQAKAKLGADIHSLYGTTSQAYDAIRGNSAAAASAFWYLHSAREDDAADKIMLTSIGKRRYPFDGGELHRRFMGRRGQVRRPKQLIIYLRDDKELDEYIKEEQGHIWYLNSGWLDPLNALGARTPPGVKKLPAPGHLRVVFNAELMEIAMVNDVSYGGSIKDLTRRIQTVFNVYRVARLDRAWDDYLARLARETGLKKKG